MRLLAVIGSELIGGDRRKDWAVLNALIAANGPGSIDVYLADAAGPATGDQSSGEVGSVYAYLLARKPLGSGVLRALAAPLQTLTVTAISTQDGSNPSVLASQAAALQLLVAAMPLGGTVDVALLEALLRGIAHESVDVAVGATYQIVQIGAPSFSGVTSVNLIAPGADFVLSAGARLSITAGLS